MPTDSSYLARLSAGEAEDFLVAKIARQAELEGSPLSELERKMLYFSTSAGPTPEMMGTNDQFEQLYDTPEYEARVSRLIRSAYDQDRKDSPDQVAEWWHAIRALREGDYYILVMVDRAHLRRPGDFLKLIGTAIGVFAAFLPLVYVAIHWQLSALTVRILIYAYFGFLGLCWVLVSRRRRRILWDTFTGTHRLRRP